MVRQTTEDYYCIICDAPCEEEGNVCNECDENGAAQALHDDQEIKE